MDNPPIIIDNGSGTIKMGHAGDEEPRCITTNVTGKPKDPNQMVGMEQKELFIGDTCYSDEKFSLLNLSFPIKQGMIVDWDLMEMIWNERIYEGLRVDPTEHKIFMTESPLTKKSSRDKMAEIVFESLQAPEMYIGITAVCALYAFGKTTGVVLDAGHTVTHSVPIYEGFALPHAIKKMDMGGQHLSEFLQGKLLEQPNIIKDLCNIKDVEKAKEKYCYVAGDYDQAIKDQTDGKGTNIVFMPDKQKVDLGQLAFQTPEVLFQPSQLLGGGKDQQGIHENIYQSIQGCCNDIRDVLYKNIILAGGTTMFRLMQPRLQKEIIALAPSTMDVNPQAPAERKYSVWIGGSILGSLSSFDEMWVKKSEWEEDGTWVHIKCF